jgi:carbonic anhydrase/acetyltransferase-like protein (isoleucine patch superfamily)
MSVPVSLRGGPFTPTILIKKRYLLFYIALIWVSFFVGLLEFWLYWQILYAEGIFFWIFLPILGLIIYFSAIFSSLIFAKLFLLIAKLIHPPQEGLFLRHPTDKDYRYWTIRNTIKRWPIWLSHKFPFPFLDNVCLKVFGVKTKFSNSLFEGWVDTEFIEFGDNVVVGQASIVQSAVIMGNFFIIRKTVIEDNVRIGAHSVVMPGTHIGKNCILGSECFTTVEQDLEEGWIYLGTPAKKYKKNDFMEEGLEDELIESQNVDIKELRMKYEENFFERHDKHLSLREKLEQRLDKREEERQRMKKEY